MESDRLFFYVFDMEGEPINFSRASGQLGFRKIRHVVTQDDRCCFTVK